MIAKDRVTQLIEQLRLQPHPEGGHYREIVRTPAAVQPDDGRGSRTALTSIYFLLAAGERSRWHRLRSDEVWHFIEGEPLELFRFTDPKGSVERVVLGPVAEGTQPVATVPAGAWQAARSTGAYTLVSCDVAPGFEFADFQLLDAESPEAIELVRRYPDLAQLI